MKYHKCIREYPDKNRCDFTELFANKDVLSSLATDLSFPFKNCRITKVAAIDALGFMLGSLCALELGAGLVLIRKDNKIL